MNEPTTMELHRELGDAISEIHSAKNVEDENDQRRLRQVIISTMKLMKELYSNSRLDENVDYIINITYHPYFATFLSFENYLSEVKQKLDEMKTYISTWSIGLW